MPENRSLKEHYEQSPKGLLYIAPAGSGKTRQALEAIRGHKSTVVTPASLTRNFNEEERKAYPNSSTAATRSSRTYTAASKHPLPGGENLVLDESHNIRNPNTSAFKALAKERKYYRKALLMTASPIVNDPSDLASQVNLVANKVVLPPNKKEFDRLIYKHVLQKPGFLARWRGAEPTVSKVLADPARLRANVKPYVHVEQASAAAKASTPKAHNQIVEVPMSRRGQALHQYYTKHLPYAERYNMERSLPTKNINAFLSKTRQLANDDAKVNRVIKDIMTSNGKTIVYSNYLKSGLDKVRSELQKRNVPTSSITGKLSKPERAQQVKDYESNKSKVMLLSGAGSEGLNLPSTTHVALMEPHYNAARLYQAAARGIRRTEGPTSKEVDVKTYVSVFPKGHRRLLGLLPARKRPISTDEYLLNLSRRKEHEGEDLIKAIS